MAVEEFKHARAISPYFIPGLGGSPDDFHGLTDVGADPSQATDDVFIVGQKDKCGTERDIPENTVPLTQLERGEIDTYLTLANLAAKPSGGIELDDFSNALVDAVYYVREEEQGTVEATIWNPKTAISSFNLSVDADERIVRSIELLGENRRILNGDENKFLIYKTNTAPSGTSGAYSIDVSDPEPNVNPFNSGEFILRVDRVRAGILDTLVEGTDYTYDLGNTEIDIVAAETGDVFQIYYSSDSFGTAGDPTTVDPDSICFLKAENATILIEDGNGTSVELDNLTSLALDATIERLNEATIGRTDRIKEITETPVTLSLTARAKSDFTVEKAFMGDVDATDMVSDINAFVENVKVTIKIYNNSDKDTFLIGYQVDNLAFNDSSFAVTANEFSSLDFTASTTDILITDDEGDL